MCHYSGAFLPTPSHNNVDSIDSASFHKYPYCPFPRLQLISYQIFDNLSLIYPLSSIIYSGPPLPGWPGKPEWFVLSIATHDPRQRSQPSEIPCQKIVSLNTKTGTFYTKNGTFYTKNRTFYTKNRTFYTKNGTLFYANCCK